MIVCIYKYVITFTGGKPDPISPQISRVQVNPSSSPLNLLRDIMFLDDLDILVIGTVDGNPPPQNQG